MMEHRRKVCAPSLMSLPPLGKQTSFNYTRRGLGALFLAVLILPIKTPELSWDKVGKWNRSYKGSRYGYWNSKMRQEIPDSTSYRARRQWLPPRTAKSEGQSKPTGGRCPTKAFRTASAVRKVLVNKTTWGPCLGDPCDPPSLNSLAK